MPNTDNAPVTTNPVTTNPVTTNPVTTNPVTTNPVTTNPGSTIPSVEPKPYRRIFVRCFVGIALVAIAIDTAPKWKFVTPLQTYLGPVLNVTGLWQGDWPLFAPNPVINNGWLSAEFYVEGSSTPVVDEDGKPLSWNSPVWSEFSAWNKFYRFRHVNYFNRAPYRGQRVIDDLTNYVARQKLGPEFHVVESNTDEQLQSYSSPSVELRLSKNALQIVLPEDGTLPPPDETTWIYIGSGLSTRKYAQ